MFLQHAMKSTTLVAAIKPRLTIDSGDMFAQRVCSLLGVVPGHDSPFIKMAALKTALVHLAERLSMTQAVVQARQSEIVTEQ